MTEATKRPWDVEFAATKSYDLIYSGSRMDSTTIARVPWTGKAEDRANTELIVKAVNSHDVLVAALEAALNTETAARIGSESGAMQGFDYKYHYDKIRRALEQVKL